MAAITQGEKGLKGTAWVWNEWDHETPPSTLVTHAAAQPSMAGA